MMTVCRWAWALNSPSTLDDPACPSKPPPPVRLFVMMNTSSWCEVCFPCGLFLFKRFEDNVQYKGGQMGGSVRLGKMSKQIIFRYGFKMGQLKISQNIRILKIV